MLLERELDVQADGGRPGLHDARFPARDDPAPSPPEKPRYLDRRGVGGIVAVNPRRCEDRDRGPEPRELLEPLDELAHDPQDPPRVRLPEGGFLGRPGEQPLVLGFLLKYPPSSMDPFSTPLRTRTHEAANARPRASVDSGQTTNPHVPEVLGYVWAASPGTPRPAPLYGW